MSDSETSDEETAETAADASDEEIKAEDALEAQDTAEAQETSEE